MPVSPIPLLQHLDGQGAATVKGLPSPEAETDAANKAYVDEKVRRIKAPAAQAISGHRAVFISANDEADYPQVARQIDGLTIVGVSAGAAAQGDDVEIYTAGAITEPGWNWTSGPVFAGNLGVLTQTPEAGVWVRQIGVAVSPTKIIIGIEPVILT